MIIGHQNVLKQLDRVISAGTISHAYLLVGPEHVGKMSVALWAAEKLLGAANTNLSLHPDIKIVERAYDEKNERFKRDLTVNEIRAAIDFAAESSFQGGHKVIIINDADRMNTEAGNALLKMLEEPPTKTIFFLLYQSVGAVMPTIRSRSQILTLGPVANEELSAALKAPSNEAELPEIIRAANGRPGLAINWLSNDAEFAEYQMKANEIIELLKVPLAEKFLRAAEFLSEAKDGGGTEELINRLQIWQEALVPSRALGTVSISPEQLTNVIDKIAATIQALRQNSHPRLTLEALLAELP